MTMDVDYDSLIMVLTSLEIASAEYFPYIDQFHTLVREILLNSYLEPPNKDYTEDFCQDKIIKVTQAIMANGDFKTAQKVKIAELLLDLLSFGISELRRKSPSCKIIPLIINPEHKVFSYYQLDFKRFFDDCQMFFRDLWEILDDKESDISQFQCVGEFLHNVHKNSSMKSSSDLKQLIHNFCVRISNFVRRFVDEANDNPEKIDKIPINEINKTIDWLLEGSISELDIEVFLSLIELCIRSHNQNKMDKAFLWLEKIQSSSNSHDLIKKWSENSCFFNLDEIKLTEDYVKSLSLLTKNGLVSYDFIEKIFVYYHDYPNNIKKELNILVKNYINYIKYDERDSIAAMALSGKPTELNLIIIGFLGQHSSYTKNSLDTLLSFGNEYKDDEYIVRLVNKTISKVVRGLSYYSRVDNSVKEYAIECLKEREKEFSANILIGLEKTSAKLTNSEVDDLINGSPKTREKGFLIAATHYDSYTLSEAVFKTKDDLFWKFISEFPKGITSEKKRAIMNEIDPVTAPSAAVEYLAKHIDDCREKTVSFLFQILKSTESSEVMKKTESVLLDLKNNCDSNVMNELIKCLEYSDDELYRFISLFLKQTKNCANNYNCKDCCLFHHQLDPILVVLRLKSTGQEEKLRISRKTKKFNIEKIAGMIFGVNVNIQDFQYGDTPESLGKKDGDVLEFEKASYNYVASNELRFIFNLVKAGCVEKFVNILETSEEDGEKTKDVFAILNNLPTSEVILDKIKNTEEFIGMIKEAKNCYILRYYFQCLLKENEEVVRKFLSECDYNIFVNKFIATDGDIENYTEIIKFFEKYSDMISEVHDFNDFAFKLLNILGDKNAKLEMFSSIVTILDKINEVSPLFMIQIPNISTIISIILTDIDKDKWSRLKNSIFKFGIDTLLFNIAKENVTNDIMCSIIGIIGFENSIPLDEYLSLIICLISSNAEVNVEKGISLFEAFAKEKISVLKDDSIFDKLFETLLSSTDDSLIECRIKFIKNIAKMKDEWNDALNRHIDEIINLNLDRFNYRPSTYQQSITKNVGIRNLRSTCFVSSVMQQLSHVVPFVYNLFTYDNEENNESIDSIKELFSKLLASKKKSVSPKKFISCWKGKGGIPLDPKEQQDASEFLNFLLDSLPEDLQAPFKGKLKHVITKFNDESDVISQIEEDFTSISLSVKSFSNMNDSLKAFTKPDNLVGNDQYEYENNKIDAKDYVKLQVAPNVIVIVLRRFEYNTTTKMQYKINDKFDICESFNIKDLMENSDEDIFYDINGIIMHNGSATSGHYMSYIKEDSWIEYNDSEVSTILPKYVFSNAASKGLTPNSNAYVLIYKKRGLEVKEGENVLSYRDMKNYIPQEIKEKIEHNNYIFEETQLAFTKNFFNFISGVDFKRRVLYMLNIAFHADYDIIPLNFFDSVIKYIPDNKEIIREVFSANKAMIFELFLHIINSKLIQVLKEFFEKSVQTFSSEEQNGIYNDFVEFLPSFIDNNRNLSDALSLIRMYISENDLFDSSKFVEPLLSFFDMLYENAAKRNTVFISSIDISSLLFIFIKFVDIIDTSLIVKHAKLVNTSPSNRGQLCRLLIQMMNNKSLPVEDLLALYSDDYKDMWKEISHSVTTADEIPTEILVHLIKNTSLSSEVFSFINSHSVSATNQFFPLIAPAIVKTWLIDEKQETRVSAVNTIFSAYPFLRGSYVEENIDSFHDFIVSFSELMDSIPTMIDDNFTTKSSNCFVELFKVFSKMLPFMDSKYVDTSITILELLCKNSLVHPNLNIYSLLSAMNYYGPQVIRDNFERISGIVFESISNMHLKIEEVAPEISAIIRFGESIGNKDEDNPFMRILSNNIISDAFEYFLTFQDDSLEFLILLEMCSKKAVSDRDGQAMQALITEYIEGINENKLQEFPKNYRNMIHASVTFIGASQYASIFRTLFKLLTSNLCVKDEVKEEFASICEIVNNFPRTSEVSSEMETDLSAFEGASNIVSILSFGSSGLKRTICSFLRNISQRSEKISRILIDTFLKKVEDCSYMFSDLAIVPIMVDISFGVNNYEECIEYVMKIVKIFRSKDKIINVIFEHLVEKYPTKSNVIYGIWNAVHNEKMAIKVSEKSGKSIINSLAEISEFKEEYIAKECMDMASNHSITRDQALELKELVKCADLSLIEENLKNSDIYVIKSVFQG